MAKITYPEYIITYCACDHLWMVAHKQRGEPGKDCPDDVPEYKNLLETPSKQIAIANWYLLTIGEAAL